jgi:hypothetical protein
MTEFRKRPLVTFIFLGVAVIVVAGPVFAAANPGSRRVHGAVPRL